MTLENPTLYTSDEFRQRQSNRDPTMPLTANDYFPVEITSGRAIVCGAWVDNTHQRPERAASRQVLCSHYTAAAARLRATSRAE